MLDKARSFGLSAAEKAALARDGFVLREAVFSRDECAAIAAECEAMVADLEAAKRGEKHRVGSYMFEANLDAATVVKWEPFFPDVVQGVEPFAQARRQLRAGRVRRVGLEAGLEPALQPVEAGVDLRRHIQVGVGHRLADAVLDARRRVAAGAEHAQHRAAVVAAPGERLRRHRVRTKAAEAVHRGRAERGHAATVREQAAEPVRADVGQRRARIARRRIRRRR